MIPGPLVELFESFRAGGHVGAVPVEMLVGFGSGVLDEETILGGATSVNAGSDRHDIAILALGNLSFAVLELVLQEFLVRKILVDYSRSSNANFVNASCFASICSLEMHRGVVSSASFIVLIGGDGGAETLAVNGLNKTKWKCKK